MKKQGSVKNGKGRKDRFLTISGLPINECYSASDASEREPPGTFPFTRGIHPTMYRSRLWTMRQYAGFGSAKEANERFRFLLSQGTSGLSVAFDLPTQMGRDPDHALSRGEVGKVGVSIATVDDMRALLEGVPLESVSISMTINATAAILLGMLLVVAEQQGVAWASLNGTIQNDILKEYMARGTYIYPPKPALRLVTDIFEFCSTEVPQWNTISISGYHIREAGSTAVQEVAFTLADGIAYVDSALQRGLQIDSFAPRLAFFFNCHNDFFEEIAKFRAARRLWATYMKERFGAKDPRSMMLRFHTQTAGSSLTAQQPLNNITRTTVQALAAVLGGTQSLHTNSFDEAWCLPTEESATVALRTQQILAYESGVADSVDPLAGSYLIENWTDRIEREARAIIERIDSMGGMRAAIEDGFPQREIDQASYDYQCQIERKERIIVGVNEYRAATEPTIPLQKISPEIEHRQVEAIRSLRSSRPPEGVQSALDSLKSAASTTENLMPLIVNALRHHATIGEISDSLRSVFGEYSNRQ